MKATQVLEKEHRVIQKMAASLALIGEDLKAEKRVPTDTLREITQFMQVFVNQCHQQKEEVYLFAVLLKKGVPAGGCPLAVLHNEHAKEQALVKQFGDAVEMYVESKGEAHTSLESSIRALIELLPAHIWKEDYLLLPMADKILSSEDQKSLRKQFDKVQSEIGPELHFRFEKFADELESAAHHAQ
ncbi:MAG TPA: hemerythrin domain-containing protein [Terriglobales bacterium]|nr:hemerythrin domain-containing protein [Terriglobales bacterium]